MKKTIFIMALGGALLAVTPATVWAHHSHAMFDTTKVETVTGTVKAIEYANPHIHIYMMVKDKTGYVVLVTVQMDGPANMERTGIELTTFKPGDIITVRLNPYRDGQSGGYYLGAIDAKGRRYGELAPSYGHRAASGFT